MINVNGVTYYEEGEIEMKTIEKILDNLVERCHYGGTIWTCDEEENVIWVLKCMYGDDSPMFSKIEDMYRDKLVDKIRRRP